MVQPTIPLNMSFDHFVKPHKFELIHTNITIFTFSKKGNLEKLKYFQDSILDFLNRVQGDLALLFYA